jgi:hypothetical protein
MVPRPVVSLCTVAGLLLVVLFTASAAQAENVQSIAERMDKSKYTFG